MMERILLGVFFLSECLILSTSVLRQFYFVNQSLNWTEAQTYCRQKYTDLVTIRNSEETNQLMNTLSSAGHSSEVWIGLFSEIDWRWSDGFTGSGAEYRNWRSESNEPNFISGKDLCVITSISGLWFDVKCSEKRQFICYKGTQLDPNFVYVSQSMNWPSAQRFCRENFVDLASVRNETENQSILKSWSSGHFPWLGLYRDPNVYWSDGSSFLFSNWYNGKIPLGSMRIVCGVTSIQLSGSWKLLSCETRLPFVCYKLPVKKQVVKLRLKTEDSVDLNDPVLKENILKKLQDRLKEDEVSGITLKWRGQLDGEVFRKEKLKEP
ncbi:secretory phospholipase A2 receptor-like [Kryptolebias marmoratus]|uniref:secretory phospholipase A2 receptor-like n=1 Tax=Kryptolebias marmoratus TaxID=37003 RepID=UPI0007F93DB9|nr:secretory phospholipase A2 receptor-like [Kryptolebias marmoratus]